MNRTEIEARWRTSILQAIEALGKVVSDNKKRLDSLDKMVNLLVEISKTDSELFDELTKEIRKEADRTDSQVTDLQARIVAISKLQGRDYLDGMEGDS